MPSGMELYIIIGILVLLFGSTQIPKLARNLGKAQTEFKKGFVDGQKDEEKPAEGDAK